MVISEEDTITLGITCKGGGFGSQGFNSGQTDGSNGGSGGGGGVYSGSNNAGGDPQVGSFN